MRITVTIDDDLFASAAELLPKPTKPSEVVAHALNVMLRMEACKRLAAAGGTAPDMADIPRRREPDFVNP
jgi:Arc/MetJ family transcription regulator